MIYLLKNPINNTIKIGRTNDPFQRLRTLQTGHAHQLEFLYIIEAEDSFEPFLHEICARYHVGGEWFSGDVLSKHLLKHPWYADENNMKPYAQWLKEQTNAIHSSDDCASVAS